jgi:hypothetical protein
MFCVCATAPIANIAETTQCAPMARHTYLTKLEIVLLLVLVLAATRLMFCAEFQYSDGTHPAIAETSLATILEAPQPDRECPFPTAPGCIADFPPIASSLRRRRNTPSGKPIQPIYDR